MRASLPAAQPRSTAGCCRRQCARPFCPPCCCSSAATAALDAWLAAEGLPAQPLRAAAVEPGGRGLVATEALRAGSRPLAVPASLLLTRDAAVAGAPAWLAPALAALPGDLPALALFLAWARAEAEAASGAGAPLPRWGAYALSLPAATGNVWEWPPGEGRRLFAALPARARQAASRQADADEALAAAASLELPAAAAPGWPRLLRWAFAALAARLVRLRGVGLGGGGEVLALVPFGDLANHRDGAGHLEWDALRRCVTLRIAQPVPAGGQVFASYGDRSSFDLLLTYGFAPDDGRVGRLCEAAALRLPAAGRGGGGGGRGEGAAAAQPPLELRADGSESAGLRAAAALAAAAAAAAGGNPAAVPPLPPPPPPPGPLARLLVSLPFGLGAALAAPLLAPQPQQPPGGGRAATEALLAAVLRAIRAAGGGAQGGGGAAAPAVAARGEGRLRADAPRGRPGPDVRRLMRRHAHLFTTTWAHVEAQRRAQALAQQQQQPLLQRRAIGGAAAQPPPQPPAAAAAEPALAVCPLLHGMVPGVPLAPARVRRAAAAAAGPRGELFIIARPPRGPAAAAAVAAAAAAAAEAGEEADSGGGDDDGDDDDGVGCEAGATEAAAEAAALAAAGFAVLSSRAELPPAAGGAGATRGTKSGATSGATSGAVAVSGASLAEVEHLLPRGAFPELSNCLCYLVFASADGNRWKRDVAATGHPLPAGAAARHALCAAAGCRPCRAWAAVAAAAAAGGGGGGAGGWRAAGAPPPLLPPPPFGWLPLDGPALSGGLLERAVAGRARRGTRGAAFRANQAREEGQRLRLQQQRQQQQQQQQQQPAGEEGWAAGAGAAAGAAAAREAAAARVCAAELRVLQRHEVLLRAELRRGG